MNENIKEFAVQKAKELMNASTCCPEAKAAVQNWLDALGTDREAEQTRTFLAELEMDIVTADGLIAFAGSEAGERVFGKEMAKNIAAHGRDLKAAGAAYCDCPACSAVAAILEKKDELL